MPPMSTPKPTPVETPRALRDRKGTQGYGKFPLPSPLDKVMADFLSGITNPADFAEHRAALQATVPGTVTLAYAERMASLAVRRQDKKSLRSGLVAVALAWLLVDDHREVWPVMALLYRAAEMVGADPAAEFAAAGTLGGADVATALAEFAARPAPDRSIADMGYEPGDDAQGFRFLRTW